MTSKLFDCHVYNLSQLSIIQNVKSGKNTDPSIVEQLFKISCKYRFSNPSVLQYVTHHSFKDRALVRHSSSLPNTSFYTEIYD
jgi:hypothetical protein